MLWISERGDSERGIFRGFRWYSISWIAFITSFNIYFQEAYNDPTAHADFRQELTELGFWFSFFFLFSFCRGEQSSPLFFNRRRKEIKLLFYILLFPSFFESSSGGTKGYRTEERSSGVRISFSSPYVFVFCLVFVLYLYYFFNS